MRNLALGVIQSFVQALRQVSRRHSDLDFTLEAGIERLSNLHCRTFV
jgi:hypothetical protein